MRTPSLLGIAASFAGFSLFFGFLERFCPDLPSSRTSESLRTDFAYWVFTPLVTKTAERLSLFAAVAVLLKIYGSPVDKEAARAFLSARGAWAAELPRFAQALITLAAADFFSYWQHRLFHGRALWRYHAVHHGSTTLDWLSAVRVHPVNDVLGRFIQFVPLIIIGFPVTAVAAYVPLLTLYAIFLHANLPWDFGPLRWVIASPRFHRWHHTSQEEGLDKNFAGLFPIWDLIFGTYYLPQVRRPERFGVRGEPVPGGFLGQLVYPLR